MTHRCWPRLSVLWSFALLSFLAALSQGSATVALKVACIGDSITEGAGLSNPSLESYPAKLGRLLGTNYTVRNYGVSGRTLLKKGDFPYWNEAAYRQSRDWNPDLAIIQLGTNDSKPQNWRYSTNFVADYEALVASYTNLSSRPLIFLCVPCPVYRNGAFDIRPEVVRTNIAPEVRMLGEVLGHPVIDLHTALGGHPEWFPDTVHPNARGMTVMAAVIRTALVGGPRPGTLPALELTRPTPNRTALQWPADWAGFVPQFATVFGATTTIWSVVEQLAVNDGATVRVTNNITGDARFYRLWQP
jgi:lysophospholipase L1-like esterase